MSITSHQIHSVLRTYGKQLRRGLTLSRTRTAETMQTLDTIRISPEAKRLQVVDRVAQEILYRLADTPDQRGEVDSQIVEALSEEYGRPLSVFYNSDEGMFNFNVWDADKKNVVEKLDGAKAEHLNRRLKEITRTVVDRTML